jgi:P-type Ca2+ transporter type 2C
MNTNRHYKGLSSEQAEENRKKYGANILTPPHKESLLRLFIEKFDDPIIKVLLIAAFLSLGIGFINNEFIETVGIFAAILLATVVSFWFEYDAGKKFNILNLVNNTTPVKVIRDGLVSEIPKKDIVVGDIVILDTGEEIPADGKILESVSLQVDESALTGEPIIYKTTNQDHFNHEATYQSDRLLKGTKIMDGNAVMQVEKVGDETEYGKVARKSSEKSGEKTPLNIQLDGLARLIGVIGFAVSFLTFFALFLKDIIIQNINLSFDNYYTLSAVLISVAIAMSKVWVPVFYDGIELFTKKQKAVPEIIEKSHWIKPIIFSALLFFIIVSAAYLFGINPLDKSSWIDLKTAGLILRYFMVAVTLIVVTVPEGLPMSVTLSLALSMRRMLKTNNLVRKMHATETMGATTVICTDKTGTLTKNQMEVYSTDFFALSNDLTENNQVSTLISESIALNSTAHLDLHDSQDIKPLGNPTEAALLLWLYNKGINYMNLRDKTETLEQLRFSTERKYMASIVFSPLLGKKVLYVKGAPEIVLDNCKNILTTDGLTEKKYLQSEIEKKLLEYQNKAMRTLGFAYEIIEDEEERFTDGKLANHNLSFLGVTAISDPIREDVADAIISCRNAGIDVKIVTGDTAATAGEIGKQIGIFSDNLSPNALIKGNDFEKMSDEDIINILPELRILCRARPGDKQRLVQLLQKTGEVVAVTGDGTNDAPALNYAHIGLSMGSGTTVAKEASDITILDDSFKSISMAVLWGRSLYQNIQKFIIFQLTINVTAMVIVLLGSLVGHELPLTVTQMLWVNLIMDTFAAGALASLPPDKTLMKKKPRKKSDFIISSPMRKHILITGIAFIIILMSMLYFMRDSDGIITRYNLTIFFTVFVMLQFWNMFNVKAFTSRRSAFCGIFKSSGFLIVLAAILLGQIMIVQFGGDVFRTVPLNLKDWLIIIASTSGILLAGEIKRMIIKQKHKIN